MSSKFISNHYTVLYDSNNTVVTDSLMTHSSDSMKNTFIINSCQSTYIVMLNFQYTICSTL